MKNHQKLLIKYIDELIETVQELEVCHKKIKQFDAIIQEKAARKKAYIATDYYKDQIAAISEAREDGWELQVEQLTNMMERQNAIRQAIKGRKKGGEDIEMTVIVTSYKEFKDDFQKMIKQIEKNDLSQID